MAVIMVAVYRVVEKSLIFDITSVQWYKQILFCLLLYIIGWVICKIASNETRLFIDEQINKKLHNYYYVGTIFSSGVSVEYNNNIFL